MHRETIERLKKIRQSYKNEIAGNIILNKKGLIDKISVNVGKQHSSTLENTCIICYHTHPDHVFSSPPSSTDLIQSYKKKTIHVVLAREGIYVYKLMRETPKGKELLKNKNKCDMFNDTLRNIVVGDSKEGVKKYMKTVYDSLGIKILYFPWSNNEIMLNF